MGLTADDTTVVGSHHQKLIDAGFSHIEASAALHQCRGDSNDALKLLVSGWKPEGFTAMADNVVVSGCPFAKSSTGKASSAPSPQRRGRVLGSSLQREFDELLLEDPSLICPITLVLFHDPVYASDGCVYEHDAIVELARQQGLSPMTGIPINSKILAAHEHKDRAGCFMKSRSQELLRFADTAFKKHNERVLARMALDQVRDYLESLTPALVPDLASDFASLCAECGVPADLQPPGSRIQRILSAQVAHAKLAAENCLVSGEDDTTDAGKSVMFCVDVSGSMRGERMQKAKENLLKIFDFHIEDEDRVAMIVFNHEVRTVYELQDVASRRSWIRTQTEKACEAGGMTAFYDALITSTNIIAKGPAGRQKWIIALTDGEDQNSHHSREATLKHLQSAGDVDVVMIGIQLQGTKTRGNLQKLSTASTKSIFIDAAGDISALDAAFEQVAELICD